MTLQFEVFFKASWKVYKQKKKKNRKNEKTEITVYFLHVQIIRKENQSFMYLTEVKSRPWVKEQ